MPDSGDKKEFSAPQCVNCELVPEANCHCIISDKICFQCRSIMKVLDRILDEPHIEYEYDPYTDEYDPFETPEEALQREWESLDPGDQVEAVRSGYFPDGFLLGGFCLNYYD